MTIDLDAIPAPRRESAQRTGASFSTPAVQAQAGKTLESLTKYEAELADQGFVARDKAALVELLALGKEQPAERQAEQAARVSLTSELNRKIKQGKQTRLKQRTLLAAGLDELGLSAADDAAREALDDGSKVLADTSSVGADGEKLGLQLLKLNGALALAPLKPLVDDRGAQAVIAKAAAQAADLLDTHKKIGQRSAGSPVVARGDLIEGLTIELLRAARRAARAASSELGRPEIAAAFELNLLYESK